jgi:CBS domain containing-hemolysin-like protein
MTDVDLLIWELIGIAASVIFSALFSGSETALTSLSRSKIEQMLDSRSVFTRPLRLWRSHPHRVLATILIGNTLVSITAGALASEVASHFTFDEAVPAAVGGTAALVLMFGEITPKAIARTFPSAVSVPAMWLIFAFYVMFFPITFVITWALRGVIRLIGGRNPDGQRVTDKDLEYLVRLGATEGSIDKDQEELLQSVIEFPDTITKEIMVPRTDIVAIPLDSTYEEVVEMAVESGFSRIPVFDGSLDKIAGIFYTKHLLDRPAPDDRETFLRKRMRPPVFVPESKKISELLKLFQEKGIHMATVVNEFGGTEGIVTLEDVVEELLGDIRDEFDVEEERLVPLTDGGYLADARIEIDEIEEKIGLQFPEEREYETLGGFLMEAVGSVPNVGTQHRFQNHEFTVSAADANRVISVQIHKLSPPAEEGSPNEPAEGHSG